MLTSRRHRPDFGFGGDVSQMTALALFIILLAFFIMISSKAGIALKHTDDVLSSVREAFGIPDILVLEGTGRASRESTVPRAGQGTSLQDIAGQFENEVPGIRAVLVRHAGRLEVRIPLNQMNILTGISTDGQVAPVMKTMIAFMSDPARASYQVRMETHLRQRDRDAHPDDSFMDQWLMKWASILIESGIADRRLSVGQGTGHPGFVTLVLEPVQLGEDLK